MHNRERPIIDAQVHTYERDHPGRPWQGFLVGPAEVTGDDMVAAMDEVGVDGALLISPFAMYRYDASFAVSVYAAHSRRFALIKPFDPHAPDIEEQVAQWAETDGVVGARVLLDEFDDWQHDDSGLHRFAAACGEQALPLNMYAPGHLNVFAELARAHPSTRLVLDHLGLLQPMQPPVPEDPFKNIDQVLSLAALDNVVIKVSGAGTLSHEPFPYPDIWPSLLRIFERFGLSRCLWGTDWTRAVELLSYEQGVKAFTTSENLDDSDRTTLMGGSLMEIYDWSPGGDI
ncbi:MAG: hypothetical protein CMO26_00575 [Thiotrichales bacterium]|nr:hypothetical protein [Thiotrichales bacterium]